MLCAHCHKESLCIKAICLNYGELRIEIISEAANQVSETTRELTPAIPWADIISMRNRLVHAYFDINLEILWKTVHKTPSTANCGP